MPEFVVLVEDFLQELAAVAQPQPDNRGDEVCPVHDPGAGVNGPVPQDPDVVGRLPARLSRRAVRAFEGARWGVKVCGPRDDRRVAALRGIPDEPAGDDEVPGIPEVIRAARVVVHLLPGFQTEAAGLVLVEGKRRGEKNRRVIDEVG